MHTLRANILTSRGTIAIELFAEKTPLTVANFVNLSLIGFYNELRFHRVIRNFVIQTGCPFGNGTGSPGYTFNDEFCSELSHNSEGKLSMANRGPNTNGSQFFITRAPTPWLDGKHTLFGQVLEGIEIVHAIHYLDTIQEIEFIDNPFPLLQHFSPQIQIWNSILTKTFPKFSAKIPNLT